MQNDPGKLLIRRYVTYVMAAVVFVALMFGLSPQAQWPQTAAIVLLSVALMGGLMAAPIRRAALQRRVIFFWTGIVIMALSVGVLAITLAYPTAVSVDRGADAFVALLLVGSMVAWLPQMSKTEFAVSARYTVVEGDFPPPPSPASSPS